MAVMTSKQLVEKCVNVAKNHKTLYVMGCFGAPLTQANKTTYCNNHSYNRNATRTSMIKAASADTFGFDCVCLIKGILWGWNGDKSKPYGGAKYASNGVPDINANTMITKCKDVSTDFSDIEVGELLWCEGHVGIYCGGGLGVECSPKWKNCVQITAVANIGSKSGYNARAWSKHGKLPYVSYGNKPAANNPTKSVNTVAQEVLKGLWGNGTERKRRLVAAGYDYSVVQKAINNLLKTDVEYYAKATYSGASFVEGLRSIGVNASYTNRKKIASANNVGSYTGTAAQNTTLLGLLKKGKLIKP